MDTGRIESQFYELIQDLSTYIGEEDVLQLENLIHREEFGSTMTSLCDHLYEADAELSDGQIRQIAAMSQALNLPADTWLELDHSA